MTPPREWELYAVKYATLVERKRSESFFRMDPHEEGDMPIDYYVWAAVSPERTIVIDTGFDAEEAGRRGRTIVRSVTEGLATIGVDAGAVGDVVVTHLHYDHIGGHAQFPRARFHLQEREMRFATGPHMCSHVMNASFTPDHIADMVRNVFAGRVSFVDGNAGIAPGITVHHVGGHSMGLQFVKVLTKRGWVVVASDATHFYENLERKLPFPVIYHLGEQVQAFHTLEAHAETPGHIVPGHDPLVLDRYPAPGPRLEGIAVRLDVTPSA